MAFISLCGILNPDLDPEDFMEVAEIISIKEYGFTSFTIHIDLLRKMVYEVNMLRSR